MRQVYGVYHNGKYLLSNEEFNIDVDVISGYETFGAANIPTIMTYGSHKADVIYIDEPSFKAIFNLDIVHRDIIHIKKFE